MKARLLTTAVGIALLLAPLTSAATKHKTDGSMSQDMRQAIAFQRAKDRADARQARLEARHPSVSYTNADRSANRSDQPEGRPVKDPGPGKKR